MKRTDYLRTTFLKAWLLALLLGTGSANHLQAQRISRTLNDSWQFRKGVPAASPAELPEDEAWETVNLPHTWNTDAYTAKEYYRGTGWYRRPLDLPQQWQGKRIFLHTEGASKRSTLYVNGQLAGEHRGGYTAATYDLTPFLNAGQTNVLAIRVDNADEEIPPISGDFTFFGGIYRDVWLTAVPQQHFELTDHGSTGIFVTTPQVSRERGVLHVRGSVRNEAAERATLELACNIYGPDGSLIETRTQNLRLNPGKAVAFEQESSPILNPQLWTPETPALYRVETLLRQRKTHEVLDRTSHYTAFRWFSFDPEQGFFLNGEPYKLRGICRHQDQKPIGPALSDEMHRRDFRLMKEMGANFIRIAHYPQDDALLEMCDREGMLVWEEIPIIDIVPESPAYADCCEENLREMIRQHYNHPSIVLWGYMNEILLVTQRRYKGAAMETATRRTLELARRLEQVLKEEDPTRLSVMAFHGSDDYNRLGLGDITDVVGWNLYQGWYGGDLTGFERFLEEQHRHHPDHLMIVSEYGAGSDRRLHSLRPRAFDFSSEYQQKYLEHYLPVLEQTPYLCGGSHWNFIDFGSAGRDESMPRINNKGLVRADRTPKDVYYYYQAAWRKDIPVLHIASRDWMRRCGVQQEGLPVMQPVKVYTNLPEVELLVDGISLGKQRVENYTAVFNVPFTSGKRLIQAQSSDKTVGDALKIDFTALPYRLDENSLKGVELAINAGSDCFFTSDESHLTWLSDQPYTPGSWGYIGGKEKSTQTEIKGTADGPLYQTLRENPDAYRFDLPAGSYEVELLFTDIYRSAASTAYLLGKGESGEESSGNRFRLCINGQSVEEALEPASPAGCFHAVKRRYLVQNETDHLLIAFEELQGKRFLSGIKIRKL